MLKEVAGTTAISQGKLPAMPPRGYRHENVIADEVSEKELVGYIGLLDLFFADFEAHGNGLSGRN